MKNDAFEKPSRPIRRNSPRLNNNVKTGRRASLEERLNAQEILKHYAEKKDITLLLNALERFAENGTFVVNEKIEQDLMLAMKERSLRETGLTAEKAIAQIAEEQNLGEITVKRRISKSSNSTASSNNPLTNFLQNQLAIPYKKKSKR